MPEEPSRPQERSGSREGPDEGSSSVPREAAFGRTAEVCGCGPAMREMARRCCGGADLPPPEEDAR